MIIIQQSSINILATRTIRLYYIDTFLFTIFQTTEQKLRLFLQHNI